MESWEQNWAGREPRCHHQCFSNSAWQNLRGCWRSLGVLHIVRKGCLGGTPYPIRLAMHCFFWILDFLEIFFLNKAFLTKKSFEIHLMTIQVPLLTEEKIEVREKITIPKVLQRIQLFFVLEGNWDRYVKCNLTILGTKKETPAENPTSYKRECFTVVWHGEIVRSTQKFLLLVFYFK